MKILCICKGGNVRSVALAQMLKEAKSPRVDPLAASAKHNDRDTLGMLFAWADRVALLSEDVRKYLPDEFKHHRKLVLVEVGRDRFGRASHPELRGLLKPTVEAWVAEATA